MTCRTRQDAGDIVALMRDLIEKRKVGRSNYYINTRLYGILTGEGMTEDRA